MKTLKKESVYSVEVPTSLLDFLLSHVSGQSRNSVKHLLSRGQVLVNGAPRRQFDHPLIPGDRVTVLPPSAGPALPFPVLYEDEGLIVIDKPAGLLSVATETEKYRTAYRILSDYLRGRDPRSRLFIVHRLDRDTSGVLLFAKDEELRLRLQEGWNGLVRKRGYWAVVEGTDLPDGGECRSLLTENKFHKVRSTKKEEGKEAVTCYKVLARRNDRALLDVDIRTGRKNQIRVHLSELGHPVLGDEKYGAESDPLGRLALHAYVLSLTDPRSGKVLTFRSPAPADFRRLFPKSFS